MFQREAHCIEMLHSNIHMHAAPNCSGKFERKCLGSIWPNHCTSQKLWPLWLLLAAAAHMVSWSPIIPCKYSECFNLRGEHCIEMLHSNIHMHAVATRLFPQIWKEMLKLGRMAKPLHLSRTLAVMIVSWMQLRIWSAGPNSWFIPCKN